MGGEALALVLCAAVLHALWNLAAKGVTEDRLLFIWLYATLGVAIWVPIAVVWVVASGERPTWVWLGAAAVSGAMHIAYGLVLQRGYAEGDLNLVYPIARGTGPLLTFAVAVTVLGERPGLAGAAGVLLVVVGVLLISYSPRKTHGPTRAGVLWGAATGVTIAAYTLWDSHAVTDLDVPPVTYFVLGLICQVAALTLMAGRRMRDVRRVWPSSRGPHSRSRCSRRWPTSSCCARCRRRRSPSSRRRGRAASWSARCSAGWCSRRPARCTASWGRPSSRPGSPRS